MTKHSLAAQLRHHAVQQGDFSVTEMGDEEILKKYTRCSCGAYHVSGQTLDRLIESSLDEKHFRTMWNDLNKSLCEHSI